MSRKRLLRLAGPLFVFAVLLLVLVLLGGQVRNGARRWLGVGGATVQPSEFVKPALVLFLAWWLRLRTEPRLWGNFVVPIGVTLVPMALMVRQPDLGSALTLMPVALVMCWASGARTWWLLLLLGLAPIGFVLLFPFLHDYQQARVLTWWAGAEMTQQDKLSVGYHLWQSLIAVGAGGVAGDGLFAGLQNQYDFLPYRSTDFLFAVVAEETGFLGGATLVLLFFGMCARVLWLAGRLRDRFARLLAIGAAALLGTQFFVHVGVCIGLLPTTGLPMPLLSYGRSSLTSAWIAVGLVAHALVQRERTLSRDRFR
jgi:rod shape determining protein RodA